MYKFSLLVAASIMVYLHDVYKKKKNKRKKGEKKLMFAVFAGFERVIFTNREGCVQCIGIRGDTVCV